VGKSVSEPEEILRILRCRESHLPVQIFDLDGSAHRAEVHIAFSECHAMLPSRLCNLNLRGALEQAFLESALGILTTLVFLSRLAPAIHQQARCLGSSTLTPVFSKTLIVAP